MKIPQLALLMTIFLLNGCSMLGYYAQSVQGQLTVLQLREPIDELIADESTPTSLKQTLQQVKLIRRFSVEKLHLPDNKSYLYYTDLKRPYVVWNVFAAPEFSLEAKNWCYFIVGCVSYRGYFDEQDAQAHANELEAQQYDVSVAGIAAYSTLGWFDDPVLNTMLSWKEHHLAGLIFHELSHQLLYVKNETAFNEAFSTAVQRIGVVEWLITNAPDTLPSYLQYLAAYADFRQLLKATRNELQELYDSDMSDEIKREQKANVISTMKQRYDSLKLQWPEQISFDNWFLRPVNNARFTSTMTYLEHVPAYLALFVDSGGRWPGFYQAVEKLSELPLELRDKQLEALKNRAIEMQEIVALIQRNGTT